LIGGTAGLLMVERLDRLPSLPLGWLAGRSPPARRTRAMGFAREDRFFRFRRHRTGRFACARGAVFVIFQSPTVSDTERIFGLDKIGLEAGNVDTCQPGMTTCAAPWWTCCGRARSPWRKRPGSAAYHGRRSGNGAPQPASMHRASGTRA